MSGWLHQNLKELKGCGCQLGMVCGRAIQSLCCDTAATRVRRVQEPTTIWHGPEGKEWAGDGWLAAPKGIAKHPPDLCYLPQKWLHTWGSDGSGHKKGVNALQWFPKTAHLLASAGLDGRVKLWDVHGGRKCRRTYDGHALGVRAITFTDDGSRFISTAYDKKMLLWDTETGQVRWHRCSVSRGGASPLCGVLRMWRGHALGASTNAVCDARVAPAARATERRVLPTAVPPRRALQIAVGRLAAAFAAAAAAPCQRCPPHLVPGRQAIAGSTAVGVRRCR